MSDTPKYDALLSKLNTDPQNSPRYLMELWETLADAERELSEARDECERLNRALAEIREEWAGAECGEPITAQEAYAIQLCKRMYRTAVDAIDARKP